MINNLCNSKSNNDIYNILETRRSIRYFNQNTVSNELLNKIVNTARFAPSAMNKQPWEFIIVNKKELVKQIFKNISLLAGSYPNENQSAPVYIVVLGNKFASKTYDVDCAFATSNILNAAWAEGLGSCVIGSVDKNAVKQLLNIPNSMEICWLIQIGYPAETPIALDSKEHNLKRTINEQGIFIVPKRSLQDILHVNKY